MAKACPTISIQDITQICVIKQASLILKCWHILTMALINHVMKKNTRLSQFVPLQYCL